MRNAVSQCIRLARACPGYNEEWRRWQEPRRRVLQRGAVQDLAWRDRVLSLVRPNQLGRTIYKSYESSDGVIIEELKISDGIFSKYPKGP